MADMSAAMLLGRATEALAGPPSLAFLRICTCRLLNVAGPMASSVESSSIVPPSSMMRLSFALFCACKYVSCQVPARRVSDAQ